jgi:hypothetical protein
VDEWVKALLGDIDEGASATGPDLAAWLSARHDRPVASTAVRHWASKGVRLPRTDGPGTEIVRLTRLGTDPTKRALYSVADAARIGTGLYGAAKTGVSV